MSEINLIAAYRDKKFAGVLTSRKATVRKGHESVGYQGAGSDDRSMTCKCGVIKVPVQDETKVEDTLTVRVRPA